MFILLFVKGRLGELQINAHPSPFSTYLGRVGTPNEARIRHQLRVWEALREKSEPAQDRSASPEDGQLVKKIDTYLLSSMR
jgi:hypothetical protein